MAHQIHTCCGLTHSGLALKCYILCYYINCKQIVYCQINFFQIKRTNSMSHFSFWRYEPKVKPLHIFSNFFFVKRLQNCLLLHFPNFFKSFWPKWMNLSFAVWFQLGITVILRTCNSANVDFKK